MVRQCPALLSVGSVLCHKVKLWLRKLLRGAALVLSCLVLVGNGGVGQCLVESRFGSMRLGSAEVKLSDVWRRHAVVRQSHVWRCLAMVSVCDERQSVE